MKIRSLYLFYESISNLKGNYFQSNRPPRIRAPSACAYSARFRMERSRTGTGIVPPDEFTLEAGDVIKITIDPIGTLENEVE